MNINVRDLDLGYNQCEELNTLSKTNGANIISNLGTDISNLKEENSKLSLNINNLIKENESLKKSFDEMTIKYNELVKQNEQLMEKINFINEFEDIN